ncbi:MAG TPA: hypothetical protein DER02_02285 [Gammaproteobacteria bacterium]|nr:hypothetical protein [Gammaproteobacteria bacterium]|tara:strand:- start:13758 stop:14672 length:915 start_codon:yes stop_codon:yes gene_type:complete
MQRYLKIAGLTLGGILIVSTVAYQLYWYWVMEKYGQHLPRIDITVATVDREYYLFTPSENTDKTMPLVFLLNGGDAGHWRFPEQFAWEELAAEAGIIIAVPVGKRAPNNEGAWQLDTTANAYQDIRYLTHIIEDISARHSVDPHRLYAVGYSLGSMFTYEIACQLSHRFAAIASYAGTMPVQPKACDPQHHVPIMHVHGANDAIIAYTKQWDWKNWPTVGTMRDIPSLIEFWRKRYRCKAASTAASANEIHSTYTACDQDATVEHYRLAEGTHEWPATLGGQPTYQTIWAFLARHSSPAPTHTY